MPPALQGHTPDIAPRFDPDLARQHMERSGFSGQLELAGQFDHVIVNDDVGRASRELVEIADRALEAAGTMSRR